VGEIFLEKTTNFITVASNLESGEPLWFGRERKKETLDEFFGTQLSARQRHRIEAASVDMWEPFKASIEQWAPPGHGRDFGRNRPPSRRRDRRNAF
jgi:transposase